MNKPSYDELEQRISLLETQMAIRSKDGNTLLSKELRAITRIFQMMMQYNLDDRNVEADVLDACLECTDSVYGMVGTINKEGKFDTTSYNSRTLSDCAFPGGLTWQLTTGMDIRGVWGMPMINNEPLICNDIASHPERTGFPEGHVPLTRFLGVPLQRGGLAIGMVAVANKNTDYSNEDKNTLVRLAALISLGSELRQQIIQLKEMDASLRCSEDRFRKAFENANEGVCLINIHGEFIKVNHRMGEIFGYTASELAQKTVYDISHPDDPVVIPDLIQQYLSGGGGRNVFEKRYIHKNGSVIWGRVSSSLIQDNDGQQMSFISHFQDITKKKQADADLEKGNQVQKEMNSALEVLLKKREEDKSELEEKMLHNTHTLILPYLQKLKQITHDDQQQTYLRLIEANVKEILSPLAFRLSSKFHGLTPTEIKISSLIKNGESNKEIAQILNTSVKTVEFHRDNLRKKLGIKNQKVNLRTYLLSLP
ncbi:MAG: PAS domain S-box protein [Desulfobacteraceae bacterium]|nr:MAG: PAS domain S-box protein [Desulfobacteraceae bacterium]